MLHQYVSSPAYDATLSLYRPDAVTHESIKFGKGTVLDSETFSKVDPVEVGWLLEEAAQRAIDSGSSMSVDLKTVPAKGMAAVRVGLVSSYSMNNSGITVSLSVTRRKRE